MNTGQPREFSEETVQRYVDGELPESLYREISERMETDVTLARRVECYRRINELLAGHNLDILSEPVPERLRRCGPRTAPGRFLRLAASLLLVAAGVLIGWQFERYLSPPADVASRSLVEHALRAHEVFAPEVLHPVEVDASESTHLRKWLGKRLAVDLRIPDLSDWDYRLLGGRLLSGSEDAPAALFMYQRDDGARISLYVARTEAGQQHTPLLFDRFGEVGVYSWIDESLRCAVVATLDAQLDRRTLHDLSDDVYEQLEL